MSKYTLVRNTSRKPVPIQRKDGGVEMVPPCREHQLDLSLVLMYHYEGLLRSKTLVVVPEVETPIITIQETPLHVEELALPVEEHVLEEEQLPPSPKRLKRKKAIAENGDSE